MRERERREGETGLHRVVLEHHLQEDRQRDHRPAERDLLEHLPRDPEPEHLRSEQVGVEQRRLAPRACAAGATRRATRGATAPTARSAATASPPSCHTRMPRTTPPMPRTERTAPTASTSRDPVYGTSLTRPTPDSTTAMITSLEQEPDPPREVGGDEAAEQRADRRGDRGRGTDQRVDLLLRLALEVPVDQGLHRRQQQRRAEPADQGPEDDDRGQALRERHRQGADRVPDRARGRTRVCGRSGRRPCCRSG